MTEYDIICIGGGSGGLAAARRASEHGAKALIIESKKLGGTCVNVGCVPKKVMWHAAQISDFAHLAKDYGFNELKTELNYAEFVDKRRAFITRLNGIYEKNLDNSNVDWINGHAEFINSNTISVNSQQYHAKHIVIAVGGTPSIPTNIPGAELGMDSDEFFSLEQLPKSMAIVGSGYIAVEIAGVMNALGVDTHLIVRKNRFLKQIDDDIYQILLAQMQSDGIHIHFETQISEVSENEDMLSLKLNTGSTLNVETLLWAIGRKPLTDNIGLKNTKVDLQPNGNIVIDEQQNTTDNSIYAIGDITGQPTLTPAAIKSGRALAERLFNEQHQAKADFTYVPTVIFSHPAIGTIGLTETEAVNKHGKNQIRVYQSTFNPLLRALTDHKVPTRMKMVCLGTKETVIGIHIIGDFADEIIQGFSVAVQMGATKADFDNTLAIHPTSGEELVTLR